MTTKTCQTTIAIARVSLEAWRRKNGQLAQVELAHLHAYLAEGARPHLLCRVFRTEAFEPAFLWLLDRKTVEGVRLAFPLPLLRIASRLALRLGRIARSDFEQANIWLRGHC